MEATANWMEETLGLAGIGVGGTNEWDLEVHDPSVFRRVAAEGSVGLGETFMEGLWDCRALDSMFDRLVRARLQDKVRPNLGLALQVVKAKFLNIQTRRRSRRVARMHYDLGNDFYQAMLDPQMQYSCGYWSGGARDLDAAQDAKLDLICRKLGIREGDSILEIGCGWGGFARFAASQYGARVVGYTISGEQAKLARERCEGLPVEIRLADYRDSEGIYDHVVSVGMFEHVGPKNYREYFRIVHKLLRQGGRFLLHTIGGSGEVGGMDPWFDKYIFPGAVLPSPAGVAKAMDDLFVLEDWHNFGPDYELTLMAWHKNFEASWPGFSEQYGEKFGRMWRYYLLQCAGSFRARGNQLWQVLLSKGGVSGGWATVR
jgi:cyclopropane-fatty-acyl-phospholipid synthase